MRYYSLADAAKFMGVSYQAVQARFGKRYTVAKKCQPPSHSIPSFELDTWMDERKERARKLLASPDLRNGQ